MHKIQNSDFFVTRVYYVITVHGINKVINIQFVNEIRCSVIIIIITITIIIKGGNF